VPTYEYACKSCNEHEEAVQSFADAPLTVCKHCGGPLRKVFGSIGISFKGSGFYKTDARSAAKKADKPAKTADTGSSSGSGSSGGGGESSGSSNGSSTPSPSAASPSTASSAAAS